MRVVEIEAEPLVERLMIAETLWAQIRGLLGRPPLRPGEGFLIRHCNSVHSFGMRYPFLAVHLDKDYVVLKTVLMQPSRFGRRVRGARSVLELPLGPIPATGYRMHLDAA